MGCHLYLRDAETGEAVQVEPHNEGGVILMDGQRTEAEMSVTYNYSHLYDLALQASNYREWNGMADFFDGKRAGSLIPHMEIIVEKLGTEKYMEGRSILDGDPGSWNYWTPTAGNAGYAMSILLAWARQHPDAVWEASG